MMGPGMMGPGMMGPGMMGGGMMGGGMMGPGMMGPGMGGPGMGGPGMGGPGMGGRGMGGSPEERAARTEAMLRRFDANGDGRITANEIPESFRPFYERIVQRAGLDPKQPLEIKSLRDAVVRMAPGGAAGGGGASGDAKAATPLVPGFGEDPKLPPVPGFGTALVAASSPSGSSGGSSKPGGGGSESSANASGSSSAGGSASDDRIRKVAARMLQENDTNKNGVLDGDEISQLSSSTKKADANGDGKITLDELVVHLGGLAGSGSASSDGSSRRKSYRFLSARERLPKGLPDWFRDTDADADGQITMAEYMGEGGSEAQAEEFAKYDVNGDGIITAAEAAKSGND
jgi:Ca2+-binding EF-hand superfamily protein